MFNRRALDFLLAGFISLSFVAALPAQPPDRADLTLQARAILRKHCGECHHANVESRMGDLNVLDRAGLDRADRAFLKPNDANASQMLRMIDEGSMPPGNRPKPSADERRIIQEWINADAAAYPAQFDDDYVFKTILADVADKPAEKVYYRYLSIHNTISDADVKFQAEPKREALQRAVNELAKGAKAELKGVDPCRTVFRVDLRQTGWDGKPFKLARMVGEKEELLETNFKVFDLILLEYPFATLPATETGKQMANLFLAPIAQSAPIPYLRADWFVEDFSRSAVAMEIRKGLDLKQPPPVAPVFGKPTASPAPANALVIRPLDSVLVRDLAPQKPAFDLTFEILDPETMKPKTRFVAGDHFYWRVTSTKRVFHEIVLTDSSGKVDVADLEQTMVAPGKPAVHKGQRDLGYELEYTGKGEDHFTVYASETAIPPGQMLRTNEHYNERIVHPFYNRMLASFYKLPDAKPVDFDPSTVVKKTITITIRPKESANAKK